MKHLHLFIFIVFSNFLQAQTLVDLSYFLPKNVTYNQDIPTPQSVLGFELGEWHVTHDKLVEYMKLLGTVSNRITIEDRGKTFEGRPMLLLTITSPENHKNVDAIRTQHLKLIDYKQSNQLNTDAMPLVVYQGFSIHGNEPSGSNSSLILAYYLAAAEGEEIEELLKNTIILLDPSFNPDGLQRFAYWANTNKSNSLNTDPNDREFHEVWPGGRTNHYWFDMNRDWLPVQLPESRARIVTYNNWMPNILTDHHEMGTNSTFFFQPGVQSRVHPLTPKLNQELTKEIGNYHAKALDNIGSLYFTEERYDDYYYGKGSTFPDINGGIGILFEQASSRGHAQETDNGLLTFPFTIRNQFTTALSTLKAAQEMRGKLLKYQKDFYVNEHNENEKNTVKAIVFGDDKDVAKTNHLAEILQRHKINLNRLNNDLTADGKHFKKETSYIISTNQTKSTIIKAMFEKRTIFSDSLFYDISAWTFPLAFNLDYAELKTTQNIGDAVQNVEVKKGEVTAKSKYAYLMEWHEYYTPKALNKILQKDIRVKLGLQPFSLDGQQFDYGTILIPVQNQNFDESELYDMINDIAQTSHVKITGVNSGLTLGIDLGSSYFKTIEKQKVAMLVGNGITSYDSGEIWHLFDQRYEMNITKLDLEYLKTVDLSEYTSIIVPSTKVKLDEATINELMDWVKQGGTIIGYKNAVKWLSTNKFIDLEFETSKVDAKNISFEQKEDFEEAQVIAGAIFDTKLDRSHPINFGYKNDNLAMFRKTTIFIKADSSSYNNPIKYSQSPLLSGYISKPNLNILKNSVPFQVKSLGKGKVVVFTDNTNFRAFWYGTNKLLMNAIFFSKFM
ncbi:M14 family zinc carboxypeptidase [Gaetbulibacter aquiaggeris]|uniref:M14 family zinc carboxypeptidase n=1 Tax=Gaetbulibacter aquiaggeris TaxID=1735373 RepID=A0ABW7MPW7_9FLAO